MSQPPPYNRQASFANLQALNPSGQPPGTSMDAEYNSIKTTLDATLANLKVIQNDDTTLGNGVVGPAQLSSQLTVGFTAPSAWVAGHKYTVSPASTVLQGTALYICLVSHTSSNFANDLLAGFWLKIFDLSTLTFGTAAQIAVSPTGNVQTNVQVSLQNLDSNKAATSHTHTASQISDSTTAGRAMLTAASVAAQQALLGLGALAFLSTAPATTVIPNQLAFTGKMNSGNLGGNQNDFTPTGWSSNSVLELTSAGNINITGFGATTDGDTKFLQNVGFNNITLLGNSSLSAAANRIALSSPMTLRAGQATTIQYDTANSAWKVLGLPAVYPAVGSFRNLRVANVATVLGDAAPGAPNNQVFIFADELVLEDSVGSTWKVSGVSVGADGTVQGVANGTDGAYSLGASTWYSIWVIGNASTNTVASLIATSATAPTLPAGYNFKARVGWMRTDGSSHFLKLLQYGRTARYTGTMPAVTGASGVATVTPSIVNYVPSTAVKIAVILAGVVAAGQNAAVGATASSSPQQITVQNTTGGGTLIAQYIADISLEASTISYNSNTAGTSVSCYGWEDTI